MKIVRPSEEMLVDYQNAITKYVDTTLPDKTSWWRAFELDALIKRTAELSGEIARLDLNVTGGSSIPCFSGKCIVEVDTHDRRYWEVKCLDNTRIPGGIRILPITETEIIALYGYQVMENVHVIK